MATVIKPNGESYAVKNLGWLLRHMRQVVTIEVSPQHHFKDPAKGRESRLIARLADGTLYIVNWVSAQVCRDWLAKRKTPIVKFY